ncbi:MAG: hypothetical protein AB1540_14775 [Bdellovibrionota bacterium]
MKYFFILLFMAWFSVWNAMASRQKAASQPRQCSSRSDEELARDLLEWELSGRRFPHQSKGCVNKEKFPSLNIGPSECNEGACSDLRNWAVVRSVKIKAVVSKGATVVVEFAVETASEHGAQKAIDDSFEFSRNPSSKSDDFGCAQIIREPRRYYIRGSCMPPGKLKYETEVERES